MTALDAELSDALAEYAAACDSLRGEQEALIADLERRRFESIVEAADLMHVDNDRDEVTWESLRVGQWLTFPDGTDGMVVARGVRTEDGVQHRVVTIKPEHGPILPVQWVDGADVKLEPPF